MRRLLEFSLLSMAACCAMQPAFARDPVQADGQADVQGRAMPVENVRFDYAQVLRAEPIYQTLHATRTEQRCEPVVVVPPPAQSGDEAPGLFSRMVTSVKDSVKDVFTREEPAPPPVPVKQDCRMVQVDRQFQRPIAYEVDYVYKGTKYRSRLVEDPGNRLRVRVSVTPWEQQAPVSP